ncbi:HNH endonuclease [Hymenobacter sp. BT507]|uniref:HNH endonuclease n=1 Tax=Hymenobacter citatus TaxID=2763506 RepID=A0ABR7MHS8_9BACT|nr:YDG/SRA domain-containing protein [Hymenobacter citatus]MBC6610612.1 HNH endonuclease [Hymenobacter citatus]
MTKQAAIIFGDIPGVLPGHEFENRLALWGAGVHRQTQAGISARRGVGAESIVLSGGYEDDADYGSVILYTGKGGRSQESGQQVANQTLTGANLELTRNQTTGLPVRVTRKVQENGQTFYRYAGLYRVAHYWHEVGKSGFSVWRFRLEQLPTLVAPADVAPTLKLDQIGQAQEPSSIYSTPLRRETTLLRLVRDTAVTREVKHLHEYRCQVCATQLLGPVGPYAEAAHIRPLGAPHHGPDALSNVLCLCPNHHVLFDLGSFSISPTLLFLGLPGSLRSHPAHVLDMQCLAYHREHLYHNNE